jgi:hypothetical protein
MSSNGGLSRRRVAGGGSSSTSGADDGTAAPGGSWSSPSVNGNAGSRTSSPTAVASSQHAGSAFEGGSKIAFDPRDLERENEDQKQGGRAPRLTIMEEVLLLGLKDKQVSFRCAVLLMCSNVSAAVKCHIFGAVHGHNSAFLSQKLTSGTFHYVFIFTRAT